MSKTDTTSSLPDPSISIRKHELQERISLDPTDGAGIGGGLLERVIEQCCQQNDPAMGTFHSYQNGSTTASSAEPKEQQGLAQNEKHDVSQSEKQTKVKKATIIRKTYSRSSSNDRAQQMQDAISILMLEKRIIEDMDSYYGGNPNAADALASYARLHGIPERFRGSVWPILLDTHPIILASRLGDNENAHLDVENEIPIKRIRAEMGRYHRRQKNLPHTQNPSPPASASSGADSTASNDTAIGSASDVLPPDPETLQQIALDTVVEDAVVAYLQENPHIQYFPGLIQVCFTLSDWIFIAPSPGILSIEEQESRSSILHKAFAQIMTIMHSTPSTTSNNSTEQTFDAVVTSRISHFLTIFRRLMPELAAYFDEEEFNGFGEEWVHTWTKWWCARELRKDEKARLWDFYLGYRPPPETALLTRTAPSSQNTPESDTKEATQPPESHSSATAEAQTRAHAPADWHPFICLALLRACKDALEELELSEIRTLLTRLPKMNMDAILKEAGKLRKELRDLGVRDEEEARRRCS
ncbi:MAG: Protein required for Brome mosaic virus replication [Pycnora praestabilis]|nr:MAG: Protein required for Brome mosaic virus replication [Pycnora praestabilis]